jgi:hypothetical protein
MYSKENVVCKEHTSKLQEGLLQTGTYIRNRAHPIVSSLPGTRGSNRKCIPFVTECVTN